MKCSYCKSTLHNIRKFPEKAKGKTIVEGGGIIRSRGRQKGRSTKASENSTQAFEKSTQASEKSTRVSKK